MAERVRWLRMKLVRLFRRGRQEAALDAEMQFHFDQLVEQFKSEGLSDRDARFAARREFGDAGSYREEVRDSWRPPELADLWRTLRFALRSLARSPGFSLLAVVMLALGIGANTVMYGVLHSIVLKPLPYEDLAHLERIDRATAHEPDGRIAPADFLDLRRSEDAYGELSAYSTGDATLSETGQPAVVTRGVRATTNFFSLLGVHAELGRDFRAGEDIPGADRVVILSRRCWQNRFGGRSDIVGHTFRIDGVSHEVVGVLPASFNDWRHLGHIDVFRPLVLDAARAADRHSTILRVIGRRAGSVSADQARGAIAAFGANQAKAHPEVDADSSWRTVALDQTSQGKDGSDIMKMCIGLSGFVLLIACSNLANLFLARTIARAREFAVRSALGASRGQLLRPLIAESLLISLAAGACAILVASWAADWLSIRSTGDNGERVAFVFDWSVFGWAFGASLVTAVAFGLAPALYASRLNLSDTLKNGGRGSTGGKGHRRFRSILIVGQFALAMVLLAGAGLFIRGLDELNNRRAGWDSVHLVTGSVTLPADRYPDAERITAFHRLVVDRIEGLPGVASASVSTFTPFFDWYDTRKVVVEGSEPPQPGHEPAVVVNGVTPHYFDTVGTRLLAGRAFDDRDGTGAPRVYVINQTMAAGLFGEESPIGRRLVQVGGGEMQSGEIVGVVADVRSVLPDPPAVVFQLYQPMAQEAAAHNELAIRTAGVAPAAVVEAIRDVMTSLDGDLPVRKLQAADATIDRANYQLGVLRDILTSFAILGLFLASLGVYGVIARTMAQRTPEFAIRFALGARAGDVTRIVLGSGIKLALLGSAIGLSGAYGVARLLSAGFPGMQLDSGWVLVGTTILLIGVALLACWLPARRAARIHPVEALRAE